jgi:hypothetical protein
VVALRFGPTSAYIAAIATACCNSWMLARVAAFLGPLVLCVACSSKPDTHGDPPASCDPAVSRRGTYVVSYSERSGTCGPIPESVSRLDGMSMTMSPSGATQCRITEPSTVDDNGCTLSNSVACTDVSGYIIEITGVTTQVDSGGARLTGIANISLRDASTGRAVCSSTYDVDYVRQ